MGAELFVLPAVRGRTCSSTSSLLLPFANRGGRCPTTQPRSQRSDEGASRSERWETRAAHVRAVVCGGVPGVPDVPSAYAPVRFSSASKLAFGVDWPAYLLPCLVR
jgi:hypothetical protein